MDRLSEQAASDLEPRPVTSQMEAGPSWLDGIPRVELPVISRTGPTKPALRQQLRFLALIDSGSGCC